MHRFTDARRQLCTESGRAAFSDPDDHYYEAAIPSGSFLEIVRDTRRLTALLVCRLLNNLFNNGLLLSQLFSLTPMEMSLTC